MNEIDIVRNIIRKNITNQTTSYKSPVRPSYKTYTTQEMRNYVEQRITNNIGAQKAQQAINKINKSIKSGRTIGGASSDYGQSFAGAAIGGPLLLYEVAKYRQGETEKKFPYQIDIKHNVTSPPSKGEIARGGGMPVNGGEQLTAVGNQWYINGQPMHMENGKRVPGLNYVYKPTIVPSSVDFGLTKPKTPTVLKTSTGGYVPIAAKQTTPIQTITNKPTTQIGIAYAPPVIKTKPTSTGGYIPITVKEKTPTPVITYKPTTQISTAYKPPVIKKTPTSTGGYVPITVKTQTVVQRQPATRTPTPAPMPAKPVTPSPPKSVIIAGKNAYNKPGGM